MTSNSNAADGDRSPEADTILSVEDLKVQFHTEHSVIRAVDGATFDVREGEIVGIVGESGAGKSVLTSSILRLLDDAGEIVDGEIRYRDETLVGFERQGDELVRSEEMLDDTELRCEIRGSEIAIVFQNPAESLNPVYTVGNQIQEFIELNRSLTGTEAKDETIKMLREVGIPEPGERFHDYPHEFSGGMRQRVLIAMAMGCRPDVIIADEPTTALDVSVEGQILDLVRDLQKDYGTAFVWVTHDMGVIAEICDRVNVMYLGKIVEQGPVDEIFHDTKHPYTQSLLDSIPRPDETVNELNPIAGVMPSAAHPPSGCRFHTRCPDAREACREIDPRMIQSTESADHSSACIKYDEVGYEGSAPLAPDDMTLVELQEDGPEESSGGAPNE